MPRLAAMPRLATVAATLLVTWGCNQEASAPMSGRADTAKRAPAAETRMALAQAAPPPPGEPGGGAAGGPSGQAQVPVPTTRKIIRNGSLEMEVPGLAAALGRIRAETEKAGGYVTSESQGTDESGARQGSITCRVPAGQLDPPANKVSDLLEVEREVARVRGEIDELEGRRRFWDSQVAFSTLTIQLSEPRPAIAGERGGIRDTLKAAFRQAGENLVATIAFCIAALGVAIPGLLVLWVVSRAWRAIRARRK